MASAFIAYYFFRFSSSIIAYTYHASVIFQIDDHMLWFSFFFFLLLLFFHILRVGEHRCIHLGLSFGSAPTAIVSSWGIFTERISAIVAFQRDAFASLPSMRFFGFLILFTFSISVKVYAILFFIFLRS